MGAACTAVWAAGFSFLDPRVLIGTLMLCGALLLGAAVLAFVDRWRKKPVNGGLSPHDQLASFRLLYEQGQMSQQEYERVKAHLTGKLKAAPAPPPAQPKAADPSAAPPPTEPPIPPPETPGA